MTSSVIELFLFFYNAVMDYKYKYEYR